MKGFSEGDFVCHGKDLIKLEKFTPIMLSNSKVLARILWEHYMLINYKHLNFPNLRWSWLQWCG